MRKKNRENLYTGNRQFQLLLMVSVAALTILSSCGVTKQPAYFKTLQLKDTTIKNFVTNDFESKIVKGDKLSVTVSSLSSAEDLLFNSGAGISASAGLSGASMNGYDVKEDGTIFLHRIGSIKAEGLTRREFAKQIEKQLLPYMKEPIVNVNYLNHKITVIGEVLRPQVINLPEEQISVLEALVLSGDVTANAKRSSITVIREEGTEKKVKHLNFEDHSVFTSPWYYMKPNDILLVSPDSEKFVKEEKRRKLQTTLSLAASGISLLIIILDRVIK